MTENSKTEGIEYLIEKAKSFEMSEDQRDEQRRSFAFGNAAFENALITREMIAEEDEKLHRDHTR